MNAPDLISTLYAAKYYRMAINPSKEYEKYCRVSAVEEDLTEAINREYDFTVIPW